MATLETLIDMGFPQTKIDKAMEVCSNNVEQAIDWLIAHSEDDIFGDAAPEESNSNGESSKAPATEQTTEDATAANVEDDSAKSIKCDECQKLFRTSEEVEFHAVKSGHTSFSESTEEKRILSEDDRKEKLKELEVKIKQRRLEKEEDDRKVAIEKEKNRIHQSKVYSDMKKKNEEMEIKKLVEERRREKMEDKLARQRVKEQIESDRIAFKERRNKQNAGGTAAAASASATTPQKVIPSSSAAQSSQKNYDSTRLQIRLPSGPPLVQNFNAKESLSAVYLWVSLNRTDGIPSTQPFKLSTTFPRKIFTEDDMEKPLHCLDLVPSAVLAMIN